MKYLPIVIVLLILAACAPPQESKAKELAEQLKQTEATEQAVQATEEAVKEVQEIEEPAKEVEQVEQTQKQIEAVEEITSPAQQRTRMYRFLDTFASKVKSYEFQYKTNKYYSRGTKYKIVLYRPVTAKDVEFGDIKKSLFYYDTVYVDRGAKTAIAYCEGHTSQVNTQCAQLELYDLAYPVQFKEYDIMMPEDWLLAYLDREPDQWDENKYYIEGRATIAVTFNEDPKLELNIDPGTGLALRADKKRGSQLIARDDYENLASNLVSDIDVMHRSRDEIPSSETFHR